MRILTIIFLISGGTLAMMRFEPHSEISGTIFERVNNVTFINNYRHLLFSINISESMINMQYLNDSLKAIDMVCSQEYMMETNGDCQQFTDFLNLNINNIRSKYSNVIAISNRRKTRSVFGTMFVIINAFAGLFTSFSSKNSFFNNQPSAEHITLTKANIQYTSQALENHGEAIKNLTADIKKLFIEHKIQELKYSLTKIVGLTTLALVQHTQITDSVINILKHQSAEKLIELIGIDSLQQTFQRLGEELKENEQFANEPLENVLNILESSPRYTSFFDCTINIHIKIPITSGSAIIYRIHRIPIKRGRELMVLNNINTILTINNDKEHLEMSREDIKNCIESVSNVKICLKPIIRYTPQCEEEIFRFNSTTHCQFDQIPFQNYVVHLEKGSLFCTIVKPLEVNFQNTEGETFSLNLTTDGFLTLEGNGILTILNETIYVDTFCRDTGCKQEIEFKIPSLNVSAINNTVKSQVTWHPTPIIIKNFNQQFQTMSNKASELLSKQSGSSFGWVEIITVSLVIFFLIKCVNHYSVRK